uniref:glucuronosyltransferase n=1 Tax=Panagrolaimus davidi TaxID=227884 RepID=A0A914Q9K6_9BILA
MSKLGDILQENGHQVIVYQPDYDGIRNHNPSKATHYTRINNKTVIYPIETEKQFLKHMWEERADDLIITARTMEFVEGIFIDACKNQLDDVEALEYLKSQNFDLGIAESFDNCGFGIFHAIGLKKIISVFTMPFPDNLSSKLGLGRSESYVPLGCAQAAAKKPLF